MVRPRTMKILAFSVVFLIVSLAVPHVSLWGAGFGAGRTEAQATPVLSASPTTASAGTSITYSVSNAAPNSGVVHFCFDPDGIDQCDSVADCTTNAQGACTFNSEIYSDSSIGNWREYVFVGDKKSNEIVINVVAAGGGSGMPNKVYRCTKNNVCITILSTEDPKAYCNAQGNDPAGANVDYGAYTADSYSKCLQDAGSSTSTGQITLASVNPNPIPENTPFTLTFDVPNDPRINRIELKIIPMGSGSPESTTYISKTANLCPPTCQKQMQGLKKGTYIFAANAQDSSGQYITWIGVSGNFDVSGTSGTVAAPQTCEQCLQDPKNFFCATVSTNIFSQPNSLGTCKVNGNNDPTALNICVPPNSVRIDQARANECPKIPPCPQQCVNYALSGYYGNVPLGTVPVGTCSTISPAASGIGGTIGGINTGVTVKPLTYGKGPIVGCDKLDDFCWCTIVNPTTSGGLGIFGTTNFGLSSIPGTREVPKWPGDPDEIKNPKVAETNQLVCDAPSDATIIAKVRPQLAQAGEQITVSGDVGRISETCTGYERTCRKITQVGCQIKDRVLWQTLSCNDCPAGSEWPGGKSYSCIGEGKRVRWSVVLGIALGVTCAFVPANCAKAISAIGKAMGGTAVAGGNIFLGGLPAAVGFCSAISQGIFTAGKCTDNSQCASGQCVEGKCVPKITGGGTDIACSASNCAACDADKCKRTPGCQDTPQLTCASAPGADTNKDTYVCVDLTTSEISCTKTKKANAECYPDPLTAIECAARKKHGDTITAATDTGGDANIKWKLCRADDNSLYCLPSCQIGDNQEGADLTHDQCVAKCGSDCASSGTSGSGTAECTLNNHKCDGNTLYRCVRGTVASKNVWSQRITYPSGSECSNNCKTLASAAGGMCEQGSAATGAVTAGGIPITGMQTGIPGGVPPVGPPVGSAEAGAVGGVAGAIGGAAFGLCVGSIIDRMTPALNPATCISVCGKKYQTKTGPNPVCDGAVVGEQEKSYKCTAGSCEGFPNKEVQITVYDSKGEVAAQAATKTDTAGKFDYTFTAPQVEGEYTASVVVPGLRASATATGNVAVQPLVP